VKEKRKKLLGFMLTALMVITNAGGLWQHSTVMAETIKVIDEGFDKGTTVPDGWTFSSGMGTYTTATNYGKSSPSLKLDKTGAGVTTKPFTLTGQGNLSFWIKGQNADKESLLRVERFDGNSWIVLEDIKPLPLTGTIKTCALDSSTTQVRFTYTKSSGNLALDDVLITQEASGPPPVVKLQALILPANAEVGLNEAVKLTLGYNPADTTEKEVVWTSENANLASVDQDGTVHGLIAGGPVTITATSKANSSITASCEVTVIDSLPTTDMPLSEARGKALNDEVVVKGVITHVPTGSGNTLYMQDSTAGIAVTFYSTSYNFQGIARGNEVRVSGKLTSFNGLLQITLNKPIEVLNASVPVPQPKVVTISQAKSEEFESQLIKIMGATLGTFDNTTKFTTLTVGNDSVNVYYMPTLTGIVPGDIVDVVAIASQFNKTQQPGYQLVVRDAADVIKVEAPDAIPPVITHTPVVAGNIGEGLTISAQVTDNKKVDSVALNYRTKGTVDYKKLPMMLNNGQYSVEIPSGDINLSGIEYYIEASDGTFTITDPKDKSKPYEITILDIDAVGPEVTNLVPSDDSSTGKDKRPVISASFSDKSGININSARIVLDGVDITSKAIITTTGFMYTPTADLKDGQHTVTVTITDKATPLPNSTVKAWNFWTGEKQLNFYFGQLHSHTNLSDGTGTPEEAYTYARDVAKADFVAITDHSNWFDNDLANENIKDYKESTSASWKKLRQTADSFNEDNKFVAIGGYEMTWSGSTGGWGHINTFNTPWFVSRNNKNMDLKAYYNKLAQSPDSISQLNHPGKTFGDFGDFSFYSPEADKVVNLIEVGNGEGPVRGSGYFPSYEYYTRALDKGWHVAPTNNQDNHKGKWVGANTARTVILANSLTRESLYQAIKEKKVYATEDENLRISYNVNGMPMGSSLNNPDKLNISIDITDPDAKDVIGKVSIIANGGTVVDSKTFNSNTAKWEITLSTQYSYYYVRVDEADKDIAVTAPVWVGDITPYGISVIEVSQNPQIVNQPVDVTTTVYNNGTTALTNVKVEYYKNSVEAGNKIGEENIPSIAAAGIASARISWTPKEVGNYRIYSKVTIIINGTEKVFTSSTTLDVSNAEELVKVVIDAGHVNQYVSGDYPGKMTALTEMLKNKKYMLVQNNGLLTDQVLENTKILVLTSPQAKDDTSKNLKRAKLSEEELQVIKRFVEKGGSIIISCRADYNDIGITDATYQNAAQGNAVLQVIGSSLRFNDDEMVDNVKNGGQSYRLYFDKYISSKYNLTKDIPEGMTYSAYSGCSVILKNGGVENSVDWLVKGHETTETLDSDNQKDATPVTKGDVKSLAAEILPNGSKIVVSGTTFFSDFEMSGDNMYSNRQITENIINWMAVPKPVELKTIAEVRADSNNDGIPDNLGKKFAIEGRITVQSEAVTPKNAFFEVVYVQDETGGITVFGVSQTALPVGTMVRVEGIVDQYKGDAEIQIANENKDLTIIDSNIVLVQPKQMTTAQSMLESNEGWLVKIQGIVKDMSNDSLFIDDGSGLARAYLEGYIGDGTDNPSAKGKWNPAIKVGDTVSVIGLASEDPQGHRLRVRNTLEIVLLDTTPPSITIKGVEEGKTYKVPVLPLIEVDDGEAAITITLNGAPYTGTPISENGNYKLEVTAVDKAGNTSHKVVNFVIDKNIYVTGISLNLESKKLYGGETLQLIATVIPSNATNSEIIWKSSDEKIVKVGSNGLVTAISAGTAVITATTKDGGKKASCTVIVELISSDPQSIVESIKNVSAGSTIKVLLNDDYKLDSSILQSISGKDITVVFEKNGITWSFNGLDIKNEIKNLDLSVSIGTTITSKSKNRQGISDKVKDENILIITLGENGVLPGKTKVTIHLGSTWANKDNLFVYYYNESTKKLEKIETNLKADEEGNITFTIEHCSDYVISQKELNEAAVIPKTGASIDMTALMGFGVLLLTFGLWVTLRRKNELE